MSSTVKEEASDPSDPSAPQTPAGPGLFVMGNTTGLPQQQRARGRTRRDDGASSAGAGLGKIRNSEEEDGATVGEPRSSNRGDYREANGDADATATTSLLGGGGSPYRLSREPETIGAVGNKFIDMCLCRDRACGQACKHTLAVVVCIFVALAFMAVIGSIVAAVSF